MRKSKPNITAVIFLGLSSASSWADSGAERALESSFVQSLTPVHSPVPGTIMVIQRTAWRADMKPQTTCFYLLKGSVTDIKGKTMSVGSEAFISVSCKEE